MGKSVESGVLKSISPSSINKFDASAPFGCQRRWWYRYVQGLDEPQSGNQFLGESLHALIEARLTEQEINMQTDPEANGLYLAGETMIEDVAKRRIVAVEASVLGYSLAGVKVQGYCDVVTEDGIIDWKTSSDIKRYGKTAEDLAVDTQMVMYARAFHPDLPSVKLAHGQFQTKGNKRTNWVECEVTSEALASHESKVIIPLVEEMKKAAALDDVSKLPRNEKSCFNCAYKSHCPTQEGNTIMSFFKKLPQNTGIPVSSALVDAGDMAVKSAPILPPDAPKSDPEKAAVPVEGFTAVPPPRRQLIVDEQEVKTDLQKFDAAVERIEAQKQAKEVAAAANAAAIEEDKAAMGITPEPAPKKRGRPPGAKNKAKLSGEVLVAPASTRHLATEMEALDASDAPRTVYDTTGTATLKSLVEASKPVAIKSVTVSKGFTVNLGSFNNVRFDVSVTGEGSDLELVYSTLMGEIEERLNAEASKYESEVDQKNKTMKPAQEVVCK